MFEIYSEQGGRSEKILDLLQDGAELNLQQQQIKGLHEVMKFIISSIHFDSLSLSGYTVPLWFAYTMFLISSELDCMGFWRTTLRISYGPILFE